ncbi:hypothetical protein [Micromonospora chersina]|uniref:hypothetical protein n=1 Tax=Micromonospora chersina TaxID=47854 RepID=UPI00371EBB45
MIQERGAAASLTAALILGLLASSGCTTDHPPSTRESPRGGGPAVTPAVAASTRVGVWPSQDFSGVFAVSARYVVRPDPRELRSVVVERRGTGAVVISHQLPDRRFQTDFAGIHGDKAVLVDEDVRSSDETKVNARGWIYDLTTGHATPVTDVPGAPPLSRYGPQAAMSTDGKYYYSASVHGGFSNCVGEIDLATMRGRVVDCASKGGSILYVNSGDAGATWTHFTSAGFDGCRVGRGIRMGKSVTIAPDACDTFDTATLGALQLRTTQTPGQPMQPAFPLVATDGTTTTELGDARGQSLIVCGGYAYWKRDVGGATPAQDLLRWRPGRPPEVVFHQPEPPSDSTEAVLLTPKACNDGSVLTVAVTRTTGGSFVATVFSLP